MARKASLLSLGQLALLCGYIWFPSYLVSQEAEVGYGLLSTFLCMTFLLLYAFSLFPTPLLIPSVPLPFPESLSFVTLTLLTLSIP